MEGRYKKETEKWKIDTYIDRYLPRKRKTERDGGKIFRETRKRERNRRWIE